MQHVAIVGLVAAALLLPVRAIAIEGDFCHVLEPCGVGNTGIFIKRCGPVECGGTCYQVFPETATLNVFERVPALRRIKLVQTFSARGTPPTTAAKAVEFVGGIGAMDGTSEVAASVDGLSVYVAGSVPTHMAVFHRDPASGRLAFAGTMDFPHPKARAALIESSQAWWRGGGP